MPGPWTVKVGVGTGACCPRRFGCCRRRRSRSRRGAKSPGRAPLESVPVEAGVESWFSFSMSAWIRASASSIRSSLSESSSCPVAEGVGFCSSSPVHPAIDASARAANRAVARNVKALVRCRVAIRWVHLLYGLAAVSESTGFPVGRRGCELSLSGHSATFHWCWVAADRKARRECRA